jgi:hypothetical protein
MNGRELIRIARVVAGVFAVASAIALGVLLRQGLVPTPGPAPTPIISNAVVEPICNYQVLPSDGTPAPTPVIPVCVLSMPAP